MATLVNFNDTNKLLLTKKTELFIDLASKDWIASANKSIKQRGAFYVALSGGRTPLEIFKSIVINKEKLSDPTKIFLFWGDERNVPYTSSESNYGQAMSILQDLRIPEEQIFRMEIENPEGAEKYQDIIERTVPDTSFDMIMLGIGQDGHTLSLFPNTEALKEKERLVVFQRVPQLDTERMTFTLPLAYRAKHIVVYVQGENKKDIVRSIFFPSDKQREAYPIELIGQEKTPLFWILAPDTYDSKDFDSISSFHKLDIL
ncbi:MULTISPECIES: 6-phosphogluconolactonase [Chlamydia]|uniref:6-phosphogluconolactonase n=2 Tax=Chlamydia TaxID=810 RepID=A0ABN0MNV3_CHLPS|nr:MULTISPECIES: 6-phosphogluconolactonase [Chlamydia]AFS19590.1 6-phosphogluconolactonase [Chlamydia psittaci 84/55]AGE75122.1 6-phosphogluconolactonase [Chlamydia psittaci Mat116]EPJ15443.1 6-phosphogluconolactonase [Chlamydia psittaci 02DC18]EPJ16668.1 6-phosphogluconolactonase [Chlamydia psittaci 02DC22]EPJ20231.1 6-phosphogluconolactonase [Chlamydia psittaci 02DC21]EPJ21325.1 6-phosphogluconolactonase [Chlamydia psittaci 02DC23]EPJ22933.1 6-phosphogluconolactonase [Chlamydia psittaci 03